jgi:hypothetical protein
MFLTNNPQELRAASIITYRLARIQLTLARFAVDVPQRFLTKVNWAAVFA